MPHLKLSAFVVLSLLMSTAMAAAQDGLPSLVASDDGLFIVDTKTKQVWARCVEGMQWDGQTCSGAPRLSTHAEAQSLANNRTKKDGLKWRVPRVKELQLLTSKSARVRQDKEVLFPVAPGDWLWSDSTSIDTSAVNQYHYKNIERGVSSQTANSLAFLHGWAVNQQTGQARGDMLKRTRLAVRLVRSDK